MNYQLIVFLILMFFLPHLSFSEIIRNGGDEGNFGEVDLLGDVIIFYNDGVNRFVCSNMVETLILTPVVATSTPQVIVGEDKKTKIEVPEDAFVTTTYISIIDPINTPQLFEEQIKGLKIELADDGDHIYKKIDSTVRVFLAYEEEGTITQDFKKQLTITIPYPDVNQDGIVDGTTIGESSLKMYVLQDNKWVEVPGGVIDILANTLSAEVRHFSVYLIRGIPFGKDLSKVYVYPNPFKPAIHNRMTFADITDSATIRIFTVAGELVKTIEVTPVDSGRPTWDGKNEDGEKVASGIYIYVITTEEGYKISGKIGIIK
ncbi:MAG: FlgD immunoglobulin-like domain containing protein [bacterium]